MQGGGVAGCLKLGHKMQIPRIRLNDFDYLKRNSNNNSNKNNKSNNKSNNKQKRGKKPVKRPRGAGGGERED